MKEKYKIIEKQNWPLGYEYKEKNTTYIYNTSCQNCRTELVFVIKKGISIEAVFSDKPNCPSCGCAVKAAK